MKSTLVFLLIAAAALWLVDCSTANKTAAPPPPSPAAIPPPPPPPADPLAADRAKYLERVRKYIAGKEQMQSDSVFRNINVFNKMPADRLLGLMDRWSETLGVSCDHCHVPGEWASEAKQPKEIARQMVALTERINKDIQSIEAIKSDHAGVSCYTCHRGAVKPARRPKQG